MSAPKATPDDEADRPRQCPESTAQRREPEHELQILGQEQKSSEEYEDGPAVQRERCSEGGNPKEPQIDQGIGEPELAAHEHDADCEPQDHPCDRRDAHPVLCDALQPIDRREHSLATPVLARRIRPALPMSWGLVLSSMGYFLLTQMGPGAEHLPLFGVATLILTLGASPVFTLTNDVIIGSAPPERAGAAAGISETCAEFGGALGIAVFGSIGVAIYRGVLGQELVHAALPNGCTLTGSHAARYSRSAPRSWPRSPEGQR